MCDVFRSSNSHGGSEFFPLYLASKISSPESEITFFQQKLKGAGFTTRVEALLAILSLVS